MKKIVVSAWVILYLTFSAYFGFGQTLEIVPPTPNAAKITEYYAQRPSLYTGTANVTIPLHTINFDGWQLPLVLSYNATGIRTNEEASEAGLGWSLNATGIISRTVVGGDDLFPGTSINGRKGYVYNDFVVTSDMGWNWRNGGVPPSDSYYKHLAGPGPDTQPDIFNLNFFGHSGSFALTQKAARADGKILVVKITESALNITFDEATKTFTVLTPEGYSGEFTVKEKSTTFSSSVNALNRIACCSESNIDYYQYENFSGRLRTVTSWYLSQITSPRGDVITFVYDYLKENGDSKYLSNTRGFGELEGITSPQVCIQTIQEHVYLKKILSDEIQVDFFMQDREDLRKNYLFTPDSSSMPKFPSSENLKRYSSINIKSKHALSTFDKLITLTQNYFNAQYHNLSANTEMELRWLRSRLDKVTIDDQEYRFYYERGAAGLPNKMTNGIDHFGFYNGQDQIVLLIPPGPVDGSFSSGGDAADSTLIEYYKQQWDRRVDFDFGKAGLLSKVKYPTKGYTTFEYEPHSYVPDHISYLFREEGNGSAGGARIKSQKQHDYNDVLLLSKSYEYVENPDAVPPAISVSTGKLMTPLYNRYTKTGYNTPDKITFLYKSNSSIPGNNAAEGKIIGYSKVHEIVSGTTGNYRNTYYFENRPNKLLTWNSLAVGFANLNGQVTEVRNYNDQGKIVQRTVNEDYYHPIDSILGIVYEQYAESGGTLDHTYLYYYAHYTIKRSFNVPYTVITTTASTPSEIVENDLTGAITGIGNSIQTLETFEYSNHLLSKEKTKDSNGDLIETEYKRAYNYTNPASALVTMKNKNIIEPVIEQIVSKNGAVISATANEYTFVANKGLLLLSTYGYNRALGAFAYSSNGNVFPSPYELRVKYPESEYTSKGKPGEFTGADGVVHSFIWGYDGLLPVVHGTGVTQDNLEIAHNAALASPDYETALRDHPSVTGKVITTFKHNPHIGIVQSVDAGGRKTTYHYDSFDRLQKVLDHDGNTVVQHDYNFKTLPPKKVLRLSGDLSFGTIVPDLFDSKPEWYVHCGKELTQKTFTIHNDGEDDLFIERLELPLQYTKTFTSATIPPESSIDITINFEPTVAFGIYTGEIVIVSDKTEGPDRIQISSTYAARICDLDVSANVVDFGTTTGSYGGQRYIEITNNGNAPVKLGDVLLDWDGVTQNYDGDDFTHPDFDVTRTARCINKNETISVPVQYLPKAPGQSSSKVSLLFDDCPDQKDAVQLNGTRIQLVSTFTTDVNSVDFGTFWQEASVTRKIKVRSSGNLGFRIQGIRVADPSLAQHYSITTSVPLPILLDPDHVEEEITIVFHPTTFGVISTDLIIEHDAMSPVGNKLIPLTGIRNRNAVISLNPPELVVDGPNQTSTITITNIGNASFSVDGFTPSNESLQTWAINNFTSGSVSPGQSKTLQVYRKPGTAIDAQITLQTTGVSSGPTTFWLKANVRELSLPGSLTMPDFTTDFVTQTVYVSNGGNQPLTITNITSSNSRYTISPTSFSLTVGGPAQALTIMYTPNDFDSQQTTFNFVSNATSGSTSFTAVGIWTPLRAVSISPTQFTFIGHGTADAQIINTGNTSLTLDGVKYGYSSTGTFNATSASWYATFPASSVTLLRGQSTTLHVQSIATNPEGQFIQVQYNKSGPYNSSDLIQVDAVTRVFSLSKTSVAFPGFTEASISDNVVMTNTGNSTLTINNITCSNAMFTASPSSFTLAPNATQNLTILFTPTAYNFSPQSGTFSFSGNQTDGNGLTASGTRTSLRTISLSPSPFAFIGSSFTWEYVNIYNYGNDYLQVTGVSNPNGSDWNAEIVGGSAIIAPNASGTLRIMKKNGNPAATTMTINSNKNSGTETIAVSGLKRIINVSPSTYTFPSFSGTATSANFTISNTGDQPLVVSGASSSNSRFTVSPTSFTVAAGGSQSVTVTYTASDFTSQSSSITFSSDATAGSGALSVTAQRTTLVQWTATPSTMTVRPWSGNSITVQNTGNQPVTLNLSFLGKDTYYTVSYSGSPANPNPPVTLQPGQVWYVSVVYKATGGNSSNSIITITQTSPTPAPPAYVTSVYTATM